MLEVALVVLFFNREVPEGPEDFAMVFFAGMVTIALKWGVYSAEKIIEMP